MSDHVTHLGFGGIAALTEDAIHASIQFKAPSVVLRAAIAERGALLLRRGDELLALARQYAGECGECDGTGKLSGEVGFEEACPDCAEIRALIAKVES